MRTILSVTAIATASLLASPVLAQSAANREAAQLLSPFTTLNATAAGRTALAQNLDAAVAVNNGANAARRQRAIDDNNQYGDGRQFTSGLGSTLDSAYQAAVAAHDSRITTLSTLIGRFTGVSGGDSAFLKTFYANGTTNGTTPATGITLPPGGQFNTYDTAYGVTTTQPGQNIYGDSRPFQVAPSRIDNFAPTITAGLANNSAFPSGHTTFGTTIALLEAIAVPENFSQEIARAEDYGYSRVVLGAHYPLDVIGGRILALHDVANLLNNNPTYTGGTDFKAQLASFTGTFRDVLTQYSGTSIANAVAAPDMGIFANSAQTKADALYRLTYGLAPVGDTTLAPVVPVGAEVLLASRFAYLSADQRRDVLASTEIASGYALDDGSGWARLDLYTAGHGYGAFTGQARVTQDAANGGLSAYDTWSNDIGGVGGLTHLGTGTLALTGNNSFSGATIIAGGKLIAGSNHALGTGDVTITDGTLSVLAAGLMIGGDFTELTGGTLDLFSPAALVDVDGLATFGGALDIDLASIGAGEYQLFGYDGYNGAFDSVTFDQLASGYTANLVYRDGGLYLDVAGAAAGVPEPSSWAMLLAGFGLIGAASRRRERSLQAV